MTPQEKAVIEAAMALYHGVQGGEDPVALDHDLTQAVECLIFYCEECNAGGHTCPGDGNPIGHTATNCGEHQELDENQNAVEQAAELSDSPIWVETTMGNCLINDQIRIGTEETTVLRSNRGIWHVSSRQEGWKDGAGDWRPEYVKGAAPWFPADRHVELRMELEAVPGFKPYPAGASIELLCTPERLAVLRMQEGFPGSAITSSHVD